MKTWIPGYNQEPDPTKPNWPESMSRSNSGGSDKSSSSFTSGGTATPKPFSATLPNQVDLLHRLSLTILVVVGIINFKNKFNPLFFIFF